MNKRNTSRFYIVVGIIWMISGMINAAVAYMNHLTETPLGKTYIGLTGMCIGLSIIFITMGIRKNK